MSVVETVLEEIRQERWRQDIQWGGAEHDDGHDEFAWWGLILTYAQKVHGGLTKPDPEEYRRRLIQVGALVVAAVQSSDRRHSPTAFPSEPYFARPEQSRDQ